MPTFTGTSGGDQITPTYVTPGVIVSGGALPGAGVDTVDGAAGNDFLMGGGGNDLMLGGTGNDTIWWNQGDGTDSVDGGADHDMLVLQTDPGADNITIAQASNLATATVNGVVAANMTHVEEVYVVTWDGADNITVGDLSTSEVTTVDVTLQGYSSLGDGAVDTVAVAGSAGNDMVQLSPLISWSDPTSVKAWTDFANGHSLAVNIDTIEATDRIVFNLGAGDDQLWDWLPFATGRLTINGEAGNDFVYGSTGQETITGGTGNDTLQGWSGHDSVSGDVGNDSIQSFGAGGDTLSGGAGNDSITIDGVGSVISGGANDDLVTWQTGGLADVSHSVTTVDGGSGTDTFAANAMDVNVSTYFNIYASGTHAHVSLVQQVGLSPPRADAQFDISNTENVQLVGSGGFALFTVGDLTGSDVRSVDVDLGAAVGSGGQAPDGKIEFLYLAGTSAADRIVLSSSAPGTLSATGFPEAITVRHVDNIDLLNVSGGAGDDTIDLSRTGSMFFQHNVNGGTGDDTISGSSAALPTGAQAARLFGDEGNDSIAGGTGDNFVYGGNGADTITTSGGHSTEIHLDRLDIGGDLISNFHTHAAAGAAGDVLTISGFTETTLAAFVADGHVVQSGANLLIVDGAHVLATLVGVSNLAISDVLLG